MTTVAAENLSTECYHPADTCNAITSSTVRRGTVTACNASQAWQIPSGHPRQRTAARSLRPATVKLPSITVDDNHQLPGRRTRRVQRPVLIITAERAVSTIA